MTVLKIDLSAGHVALIDEEDWGIAEPYTWCALVCPKAVYARTSYRKEGRTSRLLLHRLIMGALSGQFVDHINHNGKDCRRENLRFCTRAQNAANQRASRSRSTSGYKGVTWNKRLNKWVASAQVPGRLSKHIGVFTDAWEAAQAVNAVLLEAWGSFAQLNEKVPSEEIDGLIVPAGIRYTRSQKLRRNNESGYVGVTRRNSTTGAKWIAQITINGKNRYLGIFTDPWEAAQAYNVAARAAWGEAAYINERLPELVSA